MSRHTLSISQEGAGVYRPLGGDEGNAEEEDEKDLNVEKGGHGHPLKTHGS